MSQSNEVYYPEADYRDDSIAPAEAEIFDIKTKKPIEINNRKRTVYELDQVSRELGLRSLAIAQTRNKRDLRREGKKSRDNSLSNGNLEVVADSTDMLLNEATVRYRLLEPDEEIELAKAIERGDLTAKDKLINSNIRLVASVAQKHLGHGLSFNDLTNEGMLGLIRAAEKFDWRKGFKFSTYATIWIREAIQRGLDNTGKEIRRPANKAQQERKVEITESNLYATLQRQPTISEIAKEAKLSEESVLEVQLYPEIKASLDQPLGDDDSSVLGEVLTAKEVNIEEEPEETDPAIKESIKNMLDSVLGEDTTVRRAITLIYGLDGNGSRTIHDVSLELGLTYGTIAKYKTRALKALSDHVDANAELSTLLDG
jgi:RNA polymerase primary sigma factor